MLAQVGPPGIVDEATPKRALPVIPGDRNAGSRAVSIVLELKNGQATAEVTLLEGTRFKKVTEKLD